MIALAYIILAVDWLKRKFLKYFPITALVFSGFYAYGIVGGFDRYVHPDLSEVFTVAWIITALSVLWFFLERRDKRK